LPGALTRSTLAQGVRWLSGRDSALAGLAEKHGLPPLWDRPPGFATLLHIILEQQVSLASAKAAFERLKVLASPVTPRRFLALDDEALRAIGFSRQKTRYCRGLAEAILEGRLDLAALDRMEDEWVKSRLLQIKGIGPWTADIYLLMALRRPDIWPSHDLALAVAVQGVKGLASRPTPAELEEIAAPWRPWRAVAARMLWQHYLNGGRAVNLRGEMKLRSEQ